MSLRGILLSLNRLSGGSLYKARNLTAFAFYRSVGAFIPDARAKCYCPCCETKLPSWKTANFSKRPDLYDVRRYSSVPQDVVCPVCGSIPRQRTEVWHLCQRSKLLQEKKVLHFAPERGISRWMRKRGVNVTTADLNAPADLRLDLTDIDLPDACFDVVVCNHVLEHVADWRAALREIRRILRPGGLLVCSFPIDPHLPTVDEDASVADPAGRIARFGQHDHLRVFGRDSARLLEDAGFRVQIARGADCPDVIRPVIGPADYDSPNIFFCWRR